MPHTLLLADDSVTIQRVIELTFADEDVHVIAVSDGDQAIARIEASPPDIILADIGMPGKNGYEVAQYVKQSARLAHIPVVLLTGAFEPVDQARAQAAGCEGVLAKPFEPQLVIGRVKELLGKRRPAAPATPASPDAQLAPPLTMPQPLPEAIDDGWKAPRADQMPAISTDPSSVAADGLNDYFDRLDVAFANMGTPAPAPLAPAAAAPTSDDVDWFGTINPPAGAPAPERWDIEETAAEPPIADLPLSYASPLPEVEHLPMIPQAATAVAQAEVPQTSEPEQIAEHEEPATPATSPTPTGPTFADLDTALHAAPADVAPAHSMAASAVVDAPVMPATPFPVQSAAPARAVPALADAFAALLAAEQGADSSLASSEWLASATAPAPAPAPAAPEITDDLIETITKRVLERLSDRVVRETVSELVTEIAERLIREEIERIKSSIA